MARAREATTSEAPSPLARRALGVMTLLACATAAGREAQAAPEAPRAVRMKVHASSCTDDASFWDALARRTPRVRRAAAEEQADLVEIEIAREGRRIVGRMRIVPSGASPRRQASRVVVGDSCEEVVATITLMTALAIDPDAPAEPSAPPPAPSPPPAPAAAPSPPASPPPPPPAPRAWWSFGAGARGEASTLGAPAAGAGLFVELTRLADDRARVAWRPSFRVGATYAARSLTAGDARGSAAWRVIAVDLCPLRVALTSRLAALPCASIEAGALDVTAEGVAQARSITRPWVAPSLRARLAWAPFDALVLAIDGAAIVPLIRDGFTIEPSSVLFRPAPVAASAGISVAVHFL